MVHNDKIKDIIDVLITPTPPPPPLAVKWLQNTDISYMLRAIRLITIIISKNKIHDHIQYPINVDKPLTPFFAIVALKKMNPNKIANIKNDISDTYFGLNILIITSIILNKIW